MPIIKIQKHQIEEIKARRDNKELMVNIAKDYNISRCYILTLLRKHYPEIEAKPKNLKALKQDIIDRYLKGDITGEGLTNHFGITRSTVYRAFKDSGIKFIFNYTYSEVRNIDIYGDVNYSRIEEAKRIYNTTLVKNKRDLARQLGISTSKIFKYLKDTIPYKDTVEFKCSLYNTKKMKLARFLRRELNLDSKTIINISQQIELLLKNY